MAATITLKLFATLGKHLPQSADQYPIEPGTTIGQLVDDLGIPRKEAKLIFVNGIKQDPDTPLEGGDRVGIFPPVGGG